MIEQCPTNFKGSFKNYQCNICNEEELDQRHLLYCKKLLMNNLKLKHLPKYEDIYKDNLSEQKYIAELIIENIKIKEDFENPIK